MSLAQVVLFAPDVFLKPTKSGRGRLTISPELSVLIEEDVADDLLRTRELLRAFVDASVGRKPTAAAARACDALARGAASEVNRGNNILDERREAARQRRLGAGPSSARRASTAWATTPRTSRTPSRRRPRRRTSTPGRGTRPRPPRTGRRTRAGAAAAGGLRISFFLSVLF